MTKSGKWALRYDQCVSCGTVNRPYKGWGCCALCYDRLYTHADRRAECARLNADRAELSTLVVAEYMDGATVMEIGGLRGFRTGKVQGILHRSGIGKVGGKNQRVRACPVDVGA